jgi:hypothetical protein
MNQKQQNNCGITAGEKYIKNEKCSYCGKTGKLKWYIIADDLENPKPYHKKCMNKFMIEFVFYEAFSLDVRTKNS